MQKIEQLIYTDQLEKAISRLESKISENADVYLQWFKTTYPNAYKVVGLDEGCFDECCCGALCCADESPLCCCGAACGLAIIGGMCGQGGTDCAYNCLDMCCGCNDWHC